MSKENYRARMYRQAAKAMAKEAGLKLVESAPLQRTEGYAYQMAVSSDQAEATIRIYGDICEYAYEPWGEMSAVLLSSKLEELPETVSQINVHLNSYGGSVKEGMAIYNMLRMHKAHVTTFCDGMACSIASVIFMAGDTRVMSHASELMIHNAWSVAIGNAFELRKAADDLDKANNMSVKAYMSRVAISEKDLRFLMSEETWIASEEALEYGFATEIEDYSDESGNANAAAIAHFMSAKKTNVESDDERDPDEADPEAESDEGDEAVTDTDSDDESDPDDEDKKAAKEAARKKWSAIAQTLKAAK